MARVIIFSRKYPSYHTRKCENTFFVEKFLRSLLDERTFPNLVGANSLNIPVSMIGMINKSQPKNHTIREGKRWKVGDKFSPRIWSGKPYRSKQIIISPDVIVKQIWNFRLTKSNYYLNGKKLNLTQLKEVALNDGLTSDDLELWFQKPFKGQIICWSDKVNYSKNTNIPAKTGKNLLVKNLKKIGVTVN